MMNGAVTIGTLDGANIEIREVAGDDNFFLFGLTAEEVDKARAHYDPQHIIDNNKDLRRVMDLIKSGHFNQFEPGLFDSILYSIASPNDMWMTAADFEAFIEAQNQAAKAYKNKSKWARMSIINTATSGKFSTDRTMEEYNNEIWKLDHIKMNDS